MKVSIRNKTSFQLRTDVLEQFLQELEDRSPAEFSELSVAFVDDETMTDLHESYYGESGTTDVLTFNYEDGTLEIVLNPFQHRCQAEEAANSFSEEILENLLHGYLHGKGYDHTVDDGEHLRRQRDLMRELTPSTDRVVRPKETSQ